MKKLNYLVACVATSLLVGCGGLGTLGTAAGSSAGSSILGGVLGAITNGDALGNILTSVLGGERPSAEQLIGTWKYAQPGVAFTSDNLLAKAGGEVAASQIKEKLSTYYSSIGVKASNTYLTFNQDLTFSGKIAGKSLSGTYVYDPNTAQITLKTLLFSVNAYLKRSATGMAVLFESKKLLTILQTIAKISGNGTLQSIGDISTNYDGVRLGFDMGR
ncbi:MAG: DUF4923 family protein [Prevotella sp.]|nr:DUF4923 family protein [Prevotella sp.]MBR1519036.1 DUF4923 family protein [Prevotella sp.]